MGLDGGFLHCLIKELNIAVGCKVDKVYQPSKDELVLALRSKEFSGRLFISANPSSARLHFTEKAIENPAQPPMLCMLLRKHLIGSKIIGFNQYGLDRVVTIEFEGINEMGDTTRPRLIIEMMGGQSNIILTEQSGRIIDSIRRSDLEKGGRVIQPGATYLYPEKQNKINPISEDLDTIRKAISGSDVPVDKAFLNSVQGLSPVVCRELAEIENSAAISLLKSALSEGGTPTAAKDFDGNIIEFSYIPLRQYGNSASNFQYETYSKMLDEIYTAKDAKNRINHQAAQLNKLISAAKNRTLRKLDYRRRDLEKCAQKEQLRIKGELLKANLHTIKPGDKTARVQNYYDPNLAEITIELKEDLSPSANASLFFKEYKKFCNAERLLDELITIGEAELEYIESVLDALQRAESTADLNEIRNELEATGYIRRAAKGNKKSPAGKPLEYTSNDGFKILVGRNNIQNDRLTFHTAEKQDIWFHVKGFPGAHVILITEGKTPSDSTMLYAAKLAAYNTSKTKLSSSVAVDYTLVKRVKKQAGGKPGMVTYTEQKTLFVTPDKDM